MLCDDGGDFCGAILSVDLRRLLYYSDKTLNGLCGLLSIEVSQLSRLIISSLELLCDKPTLHYQHVFGYWLMIVYYAMQCSTSGLRYGSCWAWSWNYRSFIAFQDTLSMCLHCGCWEGGNLARKFMPFCNFNLYVKFSFVKVIQLILGHKMPSLNKNGTKSFIHPNDGL